ncbi:site-specific recombinase, phage integrase family [Ancylostoma duodenale]|uniref:Site-specific recombinase, phage integrase family n=1 Tax=Ancylostoma duodenale TaxID=51022 RepID=A0A0C2FGL2_9BILA|nr:site-specific recombinase, phage integrase family [Ancylostoma duodenale]
MGSRTLFIVSDPSLDQRRQEAQDTARLAVEAGMPSLGRIMEACIDESVAPGTLKIYRRVKQNFTAFASKFSMPLSALPKLRNLFIAHLIDSGRTKAIPYHVAALSHFFGPLSEVDKEIQRALLSSADRKSTPVTHRKKATPGDVKRVVQWALRLKTREAILGASMILIAFVAMLRVSELCAARLSDLTHKGKDLWWLQIRKSKTDQKSAGATVAFRIRGITASLWEQYRGMVDQSNPEQFLFETLGGDPFKTDYAARFIKKTLEGAGLGHKGLTSHSFRGGAATTAIRGGANPLNVMRAGRWKSVKALECYIDPTPL